MTDTSFHGALLWPLPAELQGGSNNRYFIDTEFTDFRHCQLVSLAIVGENGSEFYGERTDFDQARCSDFVRKVVLPQLDQFEGCAMPFDRCARHCAHGSAAYPATPGRCFATTARRT